MNKKELMEKRADLLDQMQNLVDTANKEERSLTAEEQTKFAELKGQIDGIDKTVDAAEQVRSLTKTEEPQKEEKKVDTQELEVRTFANIIRNRADANITKTDNGAIIPKTIVNKIIDKVKDISPLFGMAQKYNIKGTVSIPYVDAANDNLTIAYADEFVELEAKSTKLLTVDLSSYLTGALAKISKSLLNSTDIELTSFVINKIAVSVATFLDTAVLVGDAKMKGLSNAEQTKVVGSTVSADTLIEMKNTLKSAFQSGAIWVMAPDTLTAVQKLKDGNGRYLFNDDIVEGFTGKILGKPVYTSDQAPALGNDGAIVYINPSEALAAKLVEDSVQILNEKYATQHALGIVAWMEADVKIQNQQAVVRSVKA
jgi:HK97 family phage major capsid protein